MRSVRISWYDYKSDPVIGIHDIEIGTTINTHITDEHPNMEFNIPDGAQRFRIEFLEPDGMSPLLREAFDHLVAIWSHDGVYVRPKEDRP